MGWLASRDTDGCSLLVLALSSLIQPFIRLGFGLLLEWCLCPQPFFCYNPEALASSHSLAMKFTNSASPSWAPCSPGWRLPPLLPATTRGLPVLPPGALPLRLIWPRTARMRFSTPVLRLPP